MRRLILLLVAAAALLAPVAASAHPLGNFTVNRYGEVIVSGDRAYVVYVLDLAEIPAFQARRRGLDSRRLVARIARGLELAVDGRRAALVPVRHRIAFPDGQGGLQTLRLEIVLRGPALDRESRLSYRDRNYAGRIGWKEVVVRGERGAEVLSSTVPADGASDRLRAYPDDLLSSPLDRNAATAVVDPGPVVGVAPSLGPGKADRAPGRAADSGFASLIGRGDLSLLVILGSLGVAFFWGLVHALSPGHGKAIITAYLVGQRGTPRHAAYLGLIVTVTHTIGVFTLGLVTLLLSEFIVPDDLYPWLNLASGLLVVGVAAGIIWARLSGGHGHEHPHDHDHGHSHLPEQPGWRGLVAVGVSGGLIPCPSALVVLLAAISLHRIGFGLLLIVAFSAGLALTITCIGLLAVLARGAFRRVNLEGRLVRLLPAVSALVILAVGVAMTLRALPEVI
ncbi:MAG: nickel/cobalt transporter [Gaiellaceae bacterium]